MLTKGRHGEEMCFVASGAVAVHLPDNTMIELGSGEFFGELGLLGEQQIAPDVTSLGYCKLLMLSSRDFHALLACDEHLRERIQVVAKQRLRAIEVWKQFSQASQAEAAATPVAAPVPAPSAAAAAEAAEAAGEEREEAAAKVATKDEAKDVTAKDARAIESEAVVVRHVNGAEDARQATDRSAQSGATPGEPGLQSR